MILPDFWPLVFSNFVTSRQFDVWKVGETVALGRFGSSQEVVQSATRFLNSEMLGLLCHVIVREHGIRNASSVVAQQGSCGVVSQFCSRFH